MHAFLIIGNSTEYIVQSTKNLAKKLHAKIMYFPIVKIEDTRNLNNLIRLSFEEPTLIVCERIDEAGEEALNAFLKNLEEPQENIYFALTALSIRKVLPTIVSRCEIIKLANKRISEFVNDEGIKKFIEMKTGEKLNFIDKISKTSPDGVKARNKAIELVVNALAFFHSQLHSDNVSEAWPFAKQMVKYNIQAKNIEAAEKTLSGLKANGNVSLQLTNLVVRMSN